VLSSWSQAGTMVLKDIIKSSGCPYCGKRFEKQRRLFTTLNSFSSWRCSACGKNLRFGRYSILFFSTILTTVGGFVFCTYLFSLGISYLIRLLLLAVIFAAVAVIPRWSDIELPSGSLKGGAINK
jgi:ribosomal protein L37AE/L43A